MADRGDLPPPEPVRPVLILGLGNILLRDEGVGVRVIEALRERDLPPGVELCDGGTAGLHLLDVLAHRRRVLVIDALDAGAEPGTVFRLTPADLVGTPHGGTSPHEAGLLDALALAQHLGTSPGNVVIFGIQPGRVEAGLELSAEVARVVPEVVQRVVAELRDSTALPP